MPSLTNAHALVVGIANYQYIRPLPTTVRNDAQALYDLLTDGRHCAYPAANVTLLLDEQATLVALRQALTMLAQQTDETSTVFIYLSCHGGRIESGAHYGVYLLPVDAHYTSDQVLAQTALAGNEFTKALQAITARKVVVIFDCCHAAGLTKAAQDEQFKHGLPEGYYGQLQSGRGRVIFASSRSDELSWVLPNDPNSLFTKHLLVGLRGGIASDDGLIRVFAAVDYVQKQVAKEQLNQHPIFKADDLEENFPIALHLGGDKVLHQIYEPDAHSPFIAGPPITEPRAFFGREYVLKRLFSLWKRPPLQNAAIVGPRRSGKTSLLHYLRMINTTPRAHLRPEQRNDWLPQPERYRWVLVDFQDPRLGTQNGLLHYLLASLNLPIPEPCDLEQFMDVMSRMLRNPTVILFDEISAALHRYPELDDVFWEGLRSLATNLVGGNLAFVLATHEAPGELMRQTNHSSPFFNIFGYTARLEPFTEAEARALLANTPQPFTEADILWMLEQSGRWPLLLQILGRECLLASEDGETDNLWRNEGLLQIKQFHHLLVDGSQGIKNSI